MSNYKAIFFDFDGTLTNNTHNTWFNLLRFAKINIKGISSKRLNGLRKIFPHSLLCKIIISRLKKYNYTESQFKKDINKVELREGTLLLLNSLKKQGYSLHILSGNFIEAIVSVLGKNIEYFDSITANRILFETNGKIKDIVPTRYDMKGKAKLIETFLDTKIINASDILFVGNDYNDLWVNRLNVKTLCLNPTEEEVAQKNWGKVCYSDNLAYIKPTINELLPFENFEKEFDNCLTF